MTAALENAGDAAGERAVTRAAARLYDNATASVPRDVVVEAQRDGIIVSGRRLRERTLNDVRLREIGR